MLDIAAAPGNRQAVWYINLSDKNRKSGKITVIVDANTGAVEPLIRS